MGQIFQMTSANQAKSKQISEINVPIRKNEAYETKSKK
jgi:hypothetical protein